MYNNSRISHIVHKEEKTMKSFKDIKDLIELADIQMIDFKIVDIDGKYRHVTVPASNFSKELIQDGIGFDASNY